jgi:cytochrome c peroxidase
MRRLPKSGRIALALLCLSMSLFATGLYIKNLQPFRDPTGYVATYNTGGDIDESNAFFQQLGTNGRTCATCHQADQGFALNAAHVRQLFLETKGDDPLFAPVDGANCPDGKTGNAADHSLLLKNGLIRIGITLPTNTEFRITAVRDPYGCAITTDPNSGRPIVSVYRRPLPSTSLRFLSAVMWDGRETVERLDNEGSFQTNLFTDLKHQANDAVLGHSQAKDPPTDGQLAEIVSFELGLFTAQVSDDRAGPLFLEGGQGGPLHLQAQPYYPGINDSLGSDPHGGKFDPKVFNLYAQWLDKDSVGTDRESARGEIGLGEQIFNSAPLKITGVRGLNDNPALGDPKEIAGTCSTCHDTPGVGNHSLPLPLDIATSHSPGHESDQNIAEGLAQLSLPDVPVYLVDCPAPDNPGHRAQFYTSDPGKGLISGKCSDVNRIKGPILRGLAARAPYFHNGAAANLDELVNFYAKRFQMQLTEKQKRELVAFLNSL